MNLFVKTKPAPKPDPRLTELLDRLDALDAERRDILRELRGYLAKPTASSGEELLTAEDVERLVCERGWGWLDGLNTSRLVNLCPVTRSEFDRACDITLANAERPGIRYFLSVLESLRERSRVQTEQAIGHHRGSRDFGHGDQNL